MIDHFTKYPEEEEKEQEEEELKRACYSLSKSTKGIRTTYHHGKARNTKKIQQQNDNKQTQYHFIPSQQLCQNKN